MDFNPSVATVRELFVEYSQQLGIDLCFQNFQHELETLPGSYGLLIVASEGITPAGCVGLRPFGPGIGELKRLYVREAYRGTGLGRRLAVAAISHAHKLGYRSLRLDTLPSMSSAIHLYRSLGFREIDPTPSPSAPPLIFFELDLHSASESSHTQCS